MSSPLIPNNFPLAKRRIIIAVVSLAGIIVTLTMFVWSWQESLKEYRERFYYDTATRTGLIVDYSRGQLQDLDALKRFIEGKGNIDEQSFRAFVKPMLDRKGVQAVEWIPVVPADKRVNLEASSAHRGKGAFRITERASGGSLIPATKRDVYYPVYYVEPLQGNEKAVGFDLGSNPQRLEAISVSIRNSQPQATSRITLVQEEGKQFGFLVFDPVYISGELKGFVLEVFRAGDMLDNAIKPSSTKNLTTILSDITSPETNILLATWANAIPSTAVDTLSLTSYFFPLLTLDHVIEFAGRKWDITVSATPAYLKESASNSFIIILPFGLLLTLLLTLYLNGLLSVDFRIV